jgi:hypothetical protein
LAAGNLEAQILERDERETREPNTSFSSPLENPFPLKMDSRAGVCYMKFGVRGHSFAGFVFLEEHRLAI